MQPEIRTMGPMRIVYAELGDFGSVPDVPYKAWQVIGAYVNDHDLASRLNQGMSRLPDNMETTREGTAHYQACFIVHDDEPLPAAEGIQEAVVEPGKVAVFPHKGDYAGLGETWGRVMGEWLPQSGLTRREAPTFEIYLDRDPNHFSAEIYIPVE